MQNTQYYNYFINRYADVMNTAYLYENISSIENQMYDLTVTEMPKEYARWGDPNNIPQQMMNFTANHNTLLSQFAERTNQVRNHIQTDFNLPNQVDVSLNVYPEGAGKIHISTITPDTYPWQGVYFNGVPVKIEAVANEGYSFLHWAPNSLISDTLNPVFLDILNTDEISFDAFVEDLAIGVPTSEELPGFSVYPNPAHNTLNIRNNNKTEDFHYEIIDVNGRIVLEGFVSKGNATKQIDVRSLVNSIYLLRINSIDGKPNYFRFVKL